jgi:Sec-independent protein translocase protein TatA
MGAQKPSLSGTSRFGLKKLTEFGKELGDGNRGFKAAVSGEDKTSDSNKPDGVNKVA